MEREKFTKMIESCLDLMVTARELPEKEVNVKIRAERWRCPRALTDDSSRMPKVRTEEDKSR